MRWLSVAYSMTAAACLTLAAVHLLVWFKQPARRTHLAFSVTAIFVAAIKPFEFAMSQAQTPEQYIQALRWLHVPAAFMSGSMPARQSSGHPIVWANHNPGFPR